MPGKMSLETPHTKRKSRKSYASKVFQESSVGVVSSIAQTDSTRRKVFKVLAFFLCLTGFLYQSGKYLSVVFQYPTTVDIDVKRPSTFNIPAYTFCDNNGINRRIFCEKYPDRCEEPSEALCNKYESYCGENKTLVPKKEYYNLQKNLSTEEIIDLNVELQNFAWLVYGEKEKIKGPHFRMKQYSETFLCYSLNDRVNNSLYPLTSTQDKIFREAVNKVSVKVRADEMFVPGNRAGALFALHSPFQAVNPFETGIFMRPGRTYIIYVSMEEEIMEKRPYDTDCVNYTEIWENNGRVGPRLQDMCRQNCLSDISVLCFNCNLPFFLFPRHERSCNIEILDYMDDNNTCPDNVDEILLQCELNCRDDCRQTKFHYTVQERFQGHFDDEGNTIQDIDNIINVEIYLEGDEVIVFKHIPKYMSVEVFSSIGGFIGIWLGMSLLDITDIFEGFFRIFRYSFKKR